MSIKKKIKAVDNTWFFADLPLLVKVCTTVFIRGDFILLIVVLGVALSYLISIKFGLIMTGSFLVVRFFGEMIYWFGQQFSNRTYRPNDMGFKKLDNNAIYIIYQTLANLWVMIGLAIVVYSFLYL